MNIHLTQSKDGPTLDIEKLAQTRMLVQASSGGGKSYLIRHIFEQVADRMPSIIIDPEGEFYTIRERCSMVLVGSDGEIRIDPKTAGHVARGLLDQSCSAIIDLSDLPQRHHSQYVADFIRSVMSAPRKLWRPTLIAIDEAHRFCPEGGKQSECGDAIKDLASRGRKRGYGVMLLTQRVSKVSKDAVAECANQFIGLTTLDIDIKRAADMLGMSAREAQVLRDMQPGEWFAHGPAISAAGVSRLRATYPNTKPPAGPGQSTPPIKNAKAIASLAQTVEDSLRGSEAPLTLEEAEETIRSLRKELKDNQGNRGDKKDAKRIAQLESQIANSPLIYTETDLQDLLTRQRRELAGAVRGAVDAALHGVEVEIPAPSRPAPRGAPARPSPASDGSIAEPMQRVLDAIAWYISVGIERPATVQIAARACFSQRHTSNLLSKLSSAGLVERDAGTASLTPEGYASVEIPSPGTLDELHKNALNLQAIRGTAADVLRCIIERTAKAGDQLSTQEIAEAMGQSVRHTSNQLSKISSVGMIERSGGYARVTEVLYPQGLK
ncbi:MAG: ATP-binding protein [Phycisphaerales bacterium]